ncbi:hypothetical protein SAPIO_CDS1745 [Scedosporium apiospermum]|uniref:Uncharacterized protein n=1 Tax=Pseudallescheria apiosperma TaxID=563466 RepID=A0A084GDM9_PSEDA|nr:uncharacterized protein SAPIO_CDS1745 [Scedosporium apiospermum]KEZ45441.1 hypothetical protein SAPIO_CDS1745 [Scedosporium apiospermum]
MGSGCCSKDKDGSRALEGMRDSNAVLGESPVGGENCVLAVAAFECEKDCDDDSAHNEAVGHKHAHGNDGKHPTSACSDHMNKAFEKYAAYLENARCICRSILDRGFSSTCCASHKKETVPNSGPSTSADKEGHGLSSAHGLRTRRHHHHPKSSGVKYRGAHLHGIEAHNQDCISAAHGHDDHGDHSDHGSHDDHPHCSGNGMTCSGCANKVERALKGSQGVSQGVSHVRVNFVMGNAYFAVDPRIGNVNQIIRDVEKSTGFGCVKKAAGGQTIDVLSSGASAKALANMDIAGVTQITITNKKMVQIAYDPNTKAIISLVFATLVQLIAVPVFYRPAIMILVRERTLEMDMLVTISITAAYAYSLVAFGFRMADKPLETAEFFETSTLLITLVLLGRLISAVARIRAVAAVSLRSLQATTATIIEDGVEREIDTRLLQFGDRFTVQPHSRIPTDGRITKGASEVDESMLTGESVPVSKKPGDVIIAGTINGSPPLQAQVTRLPGKNTVTDIAQLVEEAADSKPKIRDLADRVAGWFVPAVAVIAVIVTVIWIVIGLKGTKQPAFKAVPDAVTYAIAVLAVSCPCALGLAVPMVLVVAGGIAARGGVVIKSAECTATARKVTDIVFDKTGTLTDIKPAPLSNVHSVPGAGVEATDSGGAVFRAGNPQWTNSESNPTVSAQLSAGMTLLLVTSNSNPVALFSLRTSLRPEAATVVSPLTARRIAVHIVSGDQTQAVNAIASLVGAPPENVAAQRTPAQKRDYVASLMARGKNVLFCGDGTNDAVAVAQANVGVQLSGGQGEAVSASDVTRGAADVVLLSGLNGIPFLLDVSKASYHRIVFNFVWSAVYNVLAILLAAGAFVNIRIPPAYAGLGETVSVLPVIFAAMTMLALNFRS